ncbi:MAG: MFS transporter [Proteobacteria bacterium]|nr:MFS transporter [Pseudomonadota bacterium]
MSLTLYRDIKLLAIFLLGFASGLPFLLTLSTLSFWLSEEGVSKSIIGFFMFVSLPYSIKFLWAPLLDYVKIPFVTNWLGQRRGWAILIQSLLIISLIALAQSNPSQNVFFTALMAFCVAFLAATQDILIDAYRIETLNPHQNGIGAAMESVGFRFGMLTSGAGALYLAALYDWKTAYEIMAMLVLIAMPIILYLPEPEHPKSYVPPVNDWFIEPWRHFSYKKQLKTILLVIFCIKTADTVLSSMSAPFLCDLGVSKVEYAHISKVYGISLMVIGGLLGGLFITHLGMIQSVVFSLVLQIISCLLFVIQALVGYNLIILILTIGVESFASGLTATCFIAYISNFCQKPYTATHFTLLYSFGSLCRVIISALAGTLADYLPWAWVFASTILSVIPGLIFVFRLNYKKSSHVQKAA